MGCNPLRLHEHFTHGPPQPLTLMGARSHSERSSSFHQVHNNYHPAITHCYDASGRINRRGGTERHKTIGVINGNILV